MESAVFCWSVLPLSSEEIDSLRRIRKESPYDCGSLIRPGPPSAEASYYLLAGLREAAVEVPKPSEDEQRLSKLKRPGKVFRIGADRILIGEVLDIQDKSGSDEVRDLSLYKNVDGAWQVQAAGSVSRSFR